jgi:hypothetical protein
MHTKSLNIKLYWDFYGPDAAQMAEHHGIHLKTYMEGKSIAHEVGFEATENHAFAFLRIAEADLETVKNALKPKRGERILS